MENRLQEIKRIHEKMKKKNKLKRFVDDLGLKVDNAEISFQQALEEMRASLINHPAIQAQLNRN